MQYHHLSDAIHSNESPQQHHNVAPHSQLDSNIPPSHSPVASSSPPVLESAHGSHVNASLKEWQQWSSPEAMAIAFAANRKAQMAARALFELVHQFGDNLREGWKNVLDTLLYLLKANLLPTPLILIEDFVEPSGYGSLKERFKRRPVVSKKEESGLLSWLGLTGASGSSGGDSTQNRRPTEEERELCKLASTFVSDCHPEQIVPDSRYLASSALTELINSLMHCSFTIAPISQIPLEQHHSHHVHAQQESQDDDSIVDLSNTMAHVPIEYLQKVPENDHCQGQSMQHTTSTLSLGSGYSFDGAHTQGRLDEHNVPKTVKLSMEEEEALVFLLELMISITLENRDRLAQVWALVREHIRWILTHFPQNQQLMERAVVAIIRIANRNLFRLSQSHPQQQVSPQQSNDKAKAHQATELKLQRTQSVQNKSVVIVVEPMEELQSEIDHKTKDVLTDSNSQTIQCRTNHCADDVLQFMGHELLHLRPPELFTFSRQIAFGLYELLRSNAANVHAREHWEIFFTLLEAVGANAYQEDDGVHIEEATRTKMKHKAYGKRTNHHHHRNKLGSIQSDPEEQQTVASIVDDRGYCSDDPFLGNEKEAGAVRGKRIQNPLLSAADNALLPPLRLTNKADSEEWIHVVPVVQQAQKLSETEQQQQAVSGDEMKVPIPDRPTNVCSLTVTTIAVDHPTKEVQQPHQIPHKLAESEPNKIETTDPSINSTQTAHNSSLFNSPLCPPIHASDPSCPAVEPPPPNPRAGIFKRGTVVLASNLPRHDPAAFLKVCETLVFLARDAAHITPANFAQFTRCLRIMVEASMDGGRCAPIQLPAGSFPKTNALPKQFPMPSEQPENSNEQQQQQQANTEGDKMSEQERLANCYMDASLQLLNICAQLHARAANIYREWHATTDDVPLQQHRCSTPVPNCSELWTAYWRPLLQAMARLSCDCRRRIRAQALDAFGSSFRVPALSELVCPADWEDCFAEILFPLLSRLLSSSPPISPMDPIGMEEARIRAIQFTCKILLGNLTQISRLDTFADLLRRLFELMDQFLEGNTCSDLLAEVIQESLKNCVLVCENFGVFRGSLLGLHDEMQRSLDALSKKHGTGIVGPIKMAM